LLSWKGSIAYENPDVIDAKICEGTRFFGA
jgi:hypothetical protein